MSYCVTLIDTSCSKRIKVWRSVDIVHFSHHASIHWKNLLVHM